MTHNGHIHRAKKVRELGLSASKAVLLTLRSMLLLKPYSEAYRSLEGLAGYRELDFGHWTCRVRLHSKGDGLERSIGKRIAGFTHVLPSVCGITGT